VKTKRICLVCKSEFYVFPITIQRGHGKYCSKKCYAQSMIVNKKKCLICGKELKKTEGCVSGQYCSYECFGKSIRNRLQVECDFCGKILEKRKSHITKNNFCSKSCCDAFQRKGKTKYACKICKTEFVVRGKARKAVTYCSLKCRNSDPDFLERLATQNCNQSHRKGLNKLEIAGSAILHKMGLDFKEQFLLFGKFTVDVYLEKQQLVIQWDGDYWHGNPKKFPVLNIHQERKNKNDRSCNAYLKKCGLHVLRFWESTVKNHPNVVVSEIKQVIGG